jgi:hypothetical protein
LAINWKALPTKTTIFKKMWKGRCASFALKSLIINMSFFRARKLG